MAMMMIMMMMMMQDTRHLLNLLLETADPKNLEYSTKAIHKASDNGYVDVLEWWKTCGLELRYSDRALDSACCAGHTDVLKWWKSSGLELKYSEQAIDGASWERLDGTMFIRGTVAVGGFCPKSAAIEQTLTNFRSLNEVNAVNSSSPKGVIRSSSHHSPKRYCKLVIRNVTS
ncbi:hypothetical protein BJ742DRAFT_714239 [Cladochytrium replicatum]|nr:hypothetical protein BJ742DRAFT_714239 [Cladochytrium replicatum]